MAEKTKQEFNQIDQIAGEINIGSGEYQSSRILANIIKDFRNKYPLVQFNIYSGNSDDIKERIDKGILDIGLLSEPVDISKYHFIRMNQDEVWGAFVDENSIFSQKENLSPKDLIGEPIVISYRESVQNEIINWFGEYANQINVVATGNLPYNMASLASNNTGIFISLKLNCNFDNVKFIPLNPSLNVKTVLVWKKTQQYSRLAKLFIDFIQKYTKCISDNTK